MDTAVARYLKVVIYMVSLGISLSLKLRHSSAVEHIYELGIVYALAFSCPNRKF